MKKLYIVIAIFLLLGCNQEKITQLEEEKAQLQAERALLIDENQQRDGYLQEYTTTVNDVFEALEKIRKREGFLAKYSSDVEKQSKDIKEQMLASIVSIDSSLKVSKDKLIALKNKQYASAKQAVALQETIESLTTLVEEKEVEISSLRAEMDVLNTRVAQVEQELEDTSTLLEVTTSELNTGYYIIGSEKELKSKGIIIEEGGLLGLRKAKKLAAEFSDTDFTSTDIKATISIPIESKIDKVRLISPHSDNSFNLIEASSTLTELEIIDPDQFWKMKYLVIMTKS